MKEAASMRNTLAATPEQTDRVYSTKRTALIYYSFTPAKMNFLCSLRHFKYALDTTYVFRLI